MNKYSALLFLMIFSFLFGDANVQIRLQNGQKYYGEFIGTHMNHVHILIGEKIIHYACDDIKDITSTEAFSYGHEFDYDCSKNTVTADILFPPQLDPMTGEIKQMLPDVLNPNIPKDLLYLSRKKDTGIAGSLSLFTHFMGLGHLYGSGWDVKVWLRSIPYSLAMYYFYTQAEKERDEQRPEYDIYGDPYEPPPHLFIGAIAAYIGLIYDSVYMTKKYNIKLHNEIMIMK